MAKIRAVVGNASCMFDMVGTDSSMFGSADVSTSSFATPDSSDGVEGTLAGGARFGSETSSYLAVILMLLLMPLPSWSHSTNTYPGWSGGVMRSMSDPRESLPTR